MLTEFKKGDKFKFQFKGMCPTQSVVLSGGESMPNTTAFEKQWQSLDRFIIQQNCKQQAYSSMLAELLLHSRIHTNLSKC